MVNTASTKILDRSMVRIQVFEKAREAAITLLNLKDVLTKSELETLEILLDKKFLSQLSKSLKEAKEGKLESLEKILK